MAGQGLRCAYCGEPLTLITHGVAAWRVGSEFVCNEYCADGIVPSDPKFTSTNLRSTVATTDAASE